MIADSDERKNEALRLLKKIVDKYNLSNSIVDAFNENGQIHCTLKPAENAWQTIPVKEIPIFDSIIKHIEDDKDCTVYYAIQSSQPFGEVLDLLCVSKYKEDWDYQLRYIDANYAYSYCVNLSRVFYSEFGPIKLCLENGHLIRPVENISIFGISF